MSTRWLTHCLCAALLVFGMVTLSTGKPPDLPAQDKVNCKDNPAVPEYGSSPVPVGAIELEEDAPPPEVEDAPIDTLCPWLDALLRACEERVEVWFEDSAMNAVRATASHTVQVVEDNSRSYTESNLQRLGIFEEQEIAESDPVCECVRACCACINRAVAACTAPAMPDQTTSGTFAPPCQNSCDNCLPPQKAGQTIILSGLKVMKPEACVRANDPVCRSVRACCACINHVAARCAKNVRGMANADCGKCKWCKSSRVIMRAIGRNGQGSVIVIKMVGTPDKGQAAKSGCPICQSFHACCGKVQCVMTVVVKNVQSCGKGCEKHDPSEAAEPKDEACPECTSPCPWMREKNAKPASPSSAAPIPATPLDNLKKLETARKCLKAAEECQQTGQLEKARMLYAKVRALVPGSRLDTVAEKEIEAMQAADVQAVPASGVSERAAILRQRGKEIAPQEEQETPAVQKPATPQSSDKSTCPFMLMKQTKTAAQATPGAFPNALDNLKNLEQAQEMLENAEKCVREGMLDQAAALFRQIHLVCPGSPVDRTASQEGESLTAKLGEARMLLADALRLVLTQNYDQACDLYAKLEDLLPNSLYAQIAAEHRSMIQYIGAAFRPAAEEQAEARPCCTEERVAELLEDCQRAVADGEYEKAAKFARKAQKLDHDCVAANALVFKTHLLIQLREKQKQIERAKRSQNDACVPLCPRMPEIDPAVVRDIERALQIREEVIANERKKKEAGQAEEAEPKAPPQDVEDEDGPQARRKAAEDCLARLTGIVHAGTGVEISITRDRARFALHCPPSLAPLLAAADGIGKAMPANFRNIAGYGDDRQKLMLLETPHGIICEEEEERAIPRGGVAP